MSDTPTEEKFVKEFLASKPGKCEACGSTEFDLTYGANEDAKASGISATVIYWVCVSCFTRPAQSELVRASHKIRRELKEIVESANATLAEFGIDESQDD